MAKTNWQMDDTIMPADMNQIGQEINDALAKGVHRLEDNAFSSASPGTDYPEGASVMNVNAGWDNITYAAGVVFTIRNDPNAQQFIIDGLGVTSFRMFTPGRPAFWSPLATVPLDAAMLKFNPSSTGMSATDVQAAIVELFNYLNSATNTATANTLIKRDASGRAKVAAPSATDDIARKAEVDEVQTNLTTHTNNSTVHITAAERTNWNAKASTAVATASANGLMSGAMVTKLNGIATGAQVNRAIATQAQAEAGTDNTTNMTPLRVKQAINKHQEEGIWTPTLTVDGASDGITYGMQAGKYFKTGNLVTIFGYIVLSSIGSLSGGVRIEGLPFPVQGLLAIYPSFLISNVSSLELPEGVLYVMGSINLRATVINIVYKSNFSSSYTNLGATRLTNTTRFGFEFSYFI